MTTSNSKTNYIHYRKTEIHELARSKTFFTYFTSSPSFFEIIRKSFAERRPKSMNKVTRVERKIPWNTFDSETIKTHFSRVYPRTHPRIARIFSAGWRTVKVESVLSRNFELSSRAHRESFGCDFSKSLRIRAVFELCVGEGFFFLSLFAYANQCFDCRLSCLLGKNFFFFYVTMFRTYLKIWVSEKFFLFFFRQQLIERKYLNKKVI